MSREVFVSGIGMVCPAGVTAGASFDALLAGGRFVRMGSVALDTEMGCAESHQYRWPIGQVDAVVRPELANGDRLGRFAAMAAVEAMACAGLDRTQLESMAERAAVCVGTSKGSINAFDRLLAKTLTGQQHAAVFDTFTPDCAARRIARMSGVSGSIQAPVAACATGAIAIIRAAQMIQDGDADLVLAGSADASIHPLWLGAFGRMGVLADAHPQHGAGWACRPFDRQRNGFVVGEGAGVLVLESADSLRRRQGRAMAEIGGFAMGSDSGDLTALSTNTAALESVIVRACEMAACRFADLSCVHAHGTATLSNDRIEIQALRNCLGSEVRRVPIVSFKGAIGHLLGAAGSVELGVSILAARAAHTPGTSTLMEVDPQFADLCLPAASVALAHGAILKTSLGFGGHLAAVVIRPLTD